MARKDPYKNVKVSLRIYAVLEKRRGTDSQEDYKVPSMNEFIERILWDYGMGKLSREKSAEDTAPKIVTGVGVGEVRHVSAEKAEQEPHKSGDVHRQTRRKKSA